MLPISEITKGRESKVIVYEEEFYTRCGIGFTLNAVDLIAGVTYTISVETYNQNGNYYLSTGQEIQVQVISIPVPGTVQVRQ